MGRTRFRRPRRKAACSPRYLGSTPPEDGKGGRTGARARLWLKGSGSVARMSVPGPEGAGALAGPPLCPESGRVVYGGRDGRCGVVVGTHRDGKDGYGSQGPPVGPLAGKDVGHKAEETGASLPSSSGGRTSDGAHHHERESRDDDGGGKGRDGPDGPHGKGWSYVEGGTGPARAGRAALSAGQHGRVLL